MRSVYSLVTDTVLTAQCKAHNFQVCNSDNKNHIIHIYFLYRIFYYYIIATNILGPQEIIKK